MCVLGLQPRNQGLEPMKHLVPWRPYGDVSPFNPPPPCADRYAPRDKVAMSLTHKTGVTDPTYPLFARAAIAARRTLRRPAVHSVTRRNRRENTEDACSPGSRQ